MHAEWQSRAALILTRRSSALRDHAGQWALPGGRIDDGETPEQTALREMTEEVGLTLAPDAVLGRLDDFVTRSGYAITPVVVWAGPGRVLQRNPAEVERIHRIPIDEFMRADAPLLEEQEDSDHPVLRMPVGDSWIAAPTAAMLFQFREVCIAGRATRVAHYEQPLLRVALTRALTMLPTLDGAYPLDAETIAAFRRDGHVCVRGSQAPTRSPAYRPLIDRRRWSTATTNDRSKSARRTAKRSCSRRICGGATRRSPASRWRAASRALPRELMGVDGVRLYHDQALYKEAGRRLHAVAPGSDVLAARHDAHDHDVDAAGRHSAERRFDALRVGVASRSATSGSKASATTRRPISTR